MVATVGNYCILVEDIGSAGIQAILQISAGLGTPPNQIAKKVCQAPSVLISEIDFESAEQINQLLKSIGLNTVVDSEDNISIENCQLYDVAIRYLEVTHLKETLDIISHVIGLEPQKILSLSSLPPGIIIGSVGIGLIDALQKRLGENAKLLFAKAHEDIYDIFVEDTQYLPHELKTSLEKTYGKSRGYIPLDVSYEDAKKLFVKLPKGNSSRIFQRKLLSYDLVLESENHAPEAIRALAQILDMPEKIVQRIMQNTPIVVAEALDYEQSIRMCELAKESNLNLTNRLYNFQQYSLYVDQYRHHSSIAELKEFYDIALPNRLPAKIKSGFSELECQILTPQFDAMGLVYRFEQEMVE